MNDQLFLATEHGVVTLQRDGELWREAAHSLTGQPVTSVVAREGVILAGTPHGVFRSDDRGQAWQAASTGLTTRHVRWLAYHPDISDCEFAGTEPASIFISHDGARTWRECSEVAQLRDRHGWFLPYSPNRGCVRGFAFHGSRAYAAVEVGGVLCSDDGGETWRLAGATVLLDELAFGCFVEIEAEPDAIERAVGLLGLDLASGITRSYLDLQAESRR